MPTMKEIIRRFEKPAPPDASDNDKRVKAVGLSDIEYDEYEERAAIIEYDGGLPRREAESRALEIVRKRETRE